MSKQKAYSVNQEEYHDDMESICRGSINNGDVDTGKLTMKVFVADSQPYTHKDLICIDQFIESMEEQAYDKAGEFSEDYLHDIRSQDKRQELKEVISKWLDENVGPPTFYRVTNVRVYNHVIGDWVNSGGVVHPVPMEEV